jgi:tetratricopeptide (TPR) repeat protein
MTKKLSYVCLFLIFILLLISLLEGSVNSEEHTKTAAQLHEEGLRFFNQSHYREAVEVWLQEFSIDHKNANTANNIGIAYRKLDQQRAAIEYHKKAIELNSQFGHAYYSLGLAHYDLREYEESKSAFLKAIQLNYRPGVSFFNLGLTYHYLKDYPNAEASFLKAIQFAYHLENTYYNLGLTYVEWGNYNKALEAFKEAKKINPNSPDINREIKRCNQLLEKSWSDRSAFKRESKSYSEWEKRFSAENKKLEAGNWHFAVLCIFFLIGIGIYVFLLPKIANNLKRSS